MVTELVRPQPDRPSAPPAYVEAALREAVRSAIRAQLAALGVDASRSAPVTPRADEAALLQWLAPAVRELVLESVRAGLAVQAGDTPLAAAAGAAGRSGSSTPTEALPTDRRTGSALAHGAASATPAAPVAASGPHGPQAPYPAAASADLAIIPAVTGAFLLVAGPFERFTQVRDFLEDVARIPRIIEAKPRSFTGGQLVAAVQSEYTDAQTLVDRLTTDLAPYRVVIRSVQKGQIELLIRQAVR